MGGQRGVAVTAPRRSTPVPSFRGSVSCLRLPISSRTEGLPRSGSGQQLSPWSLPMMAAILSDGPYPLATTRFAPRPDTLVYTAMRRPQCADGCARRTCHYPGAAWLRRRYLPSPRLRAHARVLWPPCLFDLDLVGTGLSRLCHPRVVHRTVLALTAWLLPKVSCPTLRQIAAGAFSLPQSLCPVGRTSCGSELGFAHPNPNGNERSPVAIIQPSPWAGAS
jgi:hypothetical protein